MTDLPLVSPSGLEAEMAADLPDLPASVTVNGRRYRPVTEPRKDDGGEVHVQVKRGGSDGTVVYKVELAGGTDPRKFALKVVPKGAKSLGQRDVLVSAELGHGNVVRFDDAEVTDDEVRIVTEWCGDPLVTVCDAKGYGADARLRLFLQVCDAVEYLHGKGVIHRDLHPGNVLVRTDVRRTGEEVLTPKVIDFNNAVTLGDGPSAPDPRALGRGSEDHVGGSQRNGHATPKNDQDTLGRSLCELLTGSALPADGRRPACVHREVWAAIRRATHGDDSKKYETVADFRADLEAHLAGHPLRGVRQSPPTVVRKFVRRHPWLVSLTVLAFLVIAALGGCAWQQLTVADQARDEANRDRERVVEVAGKYRATIAAFGQARQLKRLFDSDPDVWNGVVAERHLKTLRDIYDRDEFPGVAPADHALWRGHLYTELSETYRHLGARHDAISTCEQAVRVLRAEADRGGASDRLRAQLVSSLRRSAEIHRDFSDLSVAERRANEALADARALADGPSGGGKSRHRLALVLGTHARVSARLSQASGDDPPRRDAALAGFGEAISLWEVIQYEPSATVEDKLQVGRIRGDRARFRLDWGEVAEAAREFGTALTATEAVIARSDEDHRLRDAARARLLQGQGDTYTRLREWKRAEDALNTALEIRKRLHAAERGAPEVCADLATTHWARAALQKDLEDSTKARSEVAEGLRVLTPWQQSSSPAVGRALNRLHDLRDRIPN